MSDTTNERPGGCTHDKRFSGSFGGKAGCVACMCEAAWEEIATLTARLSELEGDQECLALAAGWRLFPYQAQGELKWCPPGADLYVSEIKPLPTATELYLSAKAAKEAAETRVKWQPIETIPQDEFVLLFWPYWSSMPVIGRRWGGRWDCSCALSEGEPPTHWMPLPTTPPAAGELDS